MGTGSDSPVILDSFTKDSPSIKMTSQGIVDLGSNLMKSPGTSWSDYTFSMNPASVFLNTGTTLLALSRIYFLDFLDK